MKLGDLVIIQLDASEYYGMIGLVINQLDDYYFKVLISNGGCRYYMNPHVRVISSPSITHK